MKIIGVTGGLASGKSTVAKLFARHGAKVIDADRVVHDLLKSDRAVINKVVRVFGREILIGSKINRAKLAAAVFQSPARLKRLEAILHPAVKKAMVKTIRQLSRKKVRAVVLDVPLLFEKQLDRLTDITVAVRAAREQQIRRARRRLGLSRSEFTSRARRQMPAARKLKRADRVIDNRGSLRQTRRQVRDLWRHIDMNIIKNRKK